MGYTTEFKGKFTLSKLPPSETIVALMKLAGEQGSGKNGQPDTYCQWQLTKDCCGLEWDGGEKFYEYEEWLQFIHDKHLKPNGITIDGEVEFDGEDSDDSGLLKVVNGKVKKQKRQLVTDDIDELIKFKNFVLKSQWAEEIKDAWKRHCK